MKENQKLIDLADQVESSETFRMDSQRFCILAEAGIEMRDFEKSADEMMAKYQLSYEEFHWLCYPVASDTNPGNVNQYDYQAMATDGDRLITKEHAAETIRYLAETGEVNWDMGAARLRSKT